MMIKNNNKLNDKLKYLLGNKISNRIINLVKKKEYNKARYMVSDIIINTAPPYSSIIEFSKVQQLNSIEDYLINKIENNDRDGI